MAVEIRDPREQELVADGRPLAGRSRDRPPGRTSTRARRKVRERFAAAAAAEREEVARRAAPRGRRPRRALHRAATGCATSPRHLRRGEAALRAGAPARAAVVARLTAEGTPADTTERHAAPLGRARAGAGAGAHELRASRSCSLGLILVPLALLAYGSLQRRRRREAERLRRTRR